MASPQTYLGNGKHEWQAVDRLGVGTRGTARLRVPGGWLYRHTSTVGTFFTTTFVPMPAVVKHEV